MSDQSIPEQLRTLANEELGRILAHIDVPPDQRFPLFLEALRMIDYWSVFQIVLPSEKRLSVPDFQLMQWGWNLVAGHFLPRVETTHKGLPIGSSTEKDWSFAMTLLHQFGRIMLTRRAADMVHYGFLTGEAINGGYLLRMADFTASQLLDVLEFSEWERLEGVVTQNTNKTYKDWQVFDLSKISIPTQVGNFFGHNDPAPFKKWKISDLDSLMLPLIKPWNTGAGMFIGYEAREEVDSHFLTEAAELVKEWRDEAGFDPQAQIAETTGADVFAIAAIVVSLHLKHIRFGLLAAKHYPEIPITQSLTIWGPIDEIVATVSHFTAWDVGRIQNAMDVITMRPEEAGFLCQYSTPFMPLLISVGNGFVVRPISSVGRNPFSSIFALLEHRNRTSVNALSKPREGWLRSEIYALFQGTRYHCLEGSVKLRSRDKVITDVDAGVFDKVTGELALFQIKWQDYFTNDVRKLRSKAKNLTTEFDEWASKVTQWVREKGPNGVASTLKIGGRRSRPMSNVFLFGISRTWARTQGFGFTAKHANLAIANWPQFMRTRFTVGPAPHVFQEIHRVLQSEAEETVKTKPIPCEFKIGGRLLQFENLWAGFE